MSTEPYEAVLDAVIRHDCCPKPSGDGHAALCLTHMYRKPAGVERSAREVGCGWRCSMSCIYNNIPDEIVNIDNWLCWRVGTLGGRLVTVPYQFWGPPADLEDRRTWTDYPSAVSRAQDSDSGFDGVGFVFTGETPFCCVDLQGCVGESGKLSPEVCAVIARLNSYAEFAPGGRSVRIFVRGKLPASAPRRTTGFQGVSQVEFIDNAFVTMTGRQVLGTSAAAEDRFEELLDFHSAVFPSHTSSRFLNLVRPPADARIWGEVGPYARGGASRAPRVRIARPETGGRNEAS